MRRDREVHFKIALKPFKKATWKLARFEDFPERERLPSRYALNEFLNQ